MCKSLTSEHLQFEVLKSFVPFSEPRWPVSFVTELHLAQMSGGLPTEKSVAGEDAAQLEPVIVMGEAVPA